MHRLPRAAFVLLLALAFGACGGDKVTHQRDLDGEVPPPLVLTGTTWLNSDPLTLSALRGKVVYMEFGFHG
jgi:hypothetical protein